MQLRIRGPAAAFLVLGLAFFLAGRASLAQTPLCAGDKTKENLPSASKVRLDFLPYRVPNIISCNANRDIQFLWSSNYQTMFGVPLPTADLDQFGISLTETYKNPFNFPMSDIQLVHDYEVLRRSFRDSVYAVCPALNGFRVNQPSYPDAERCYDRSDNRDKEDFGREVFLAQRSSQQITEKHKRWRPNHCR